MNRTKNGLKTGIIGIICNLALASVKFFIGMITSSISIQSDAINNFGDTVSSLAVALSFIISGKKADKEHPYGHGRIEYIIGLTIAVLIIVVGIEFLISSIKRITNPQPVTFSWLFFCIILLGILVKIGMAIFYHISNKKLKSPSIEAAKMDSIQDCLISSVTLISFAVAPLTSFPVDGIAGGAISLFILFSGLKMVKGTLDTILGGPQDSGLVSKIMSKVMSHMNVLGAHDLLLHDYGPNNSVASIHAELPDSLSLTDAHRIVDEIERSIYKEYGVDLVVHIDPVDIDDAECKKYRGFVRKKLESIDKKLNYHDFNMDKETMVITFDVVVPYKLKIEEIAIKEELSKIDTGNYKLSYRIDYQ